MRKLLFIAGSIFVGLLMLAGASCVPTTQGVAPEATEATGATETLEVSVKPVPDWSPYHYFVRSSTIFIEEDEYQIGLQKIHEQFPAPVLVNSREEADVEIVIKGYLGNSVYPGTIYVNYSENASQIADFIRANTIEAIVLEKEEVMFSQLASELESKFKQEGVLIRNNTISLSSKDYYRFLLRLRSSPETIKLMQESDIEWIAGDYFSSYNRIDSRADFEEINNFISKSLQ